MSKDLDIHKCVSSELLRRYLKSKRSNEWDWLTRFENDYVKGAEAEKWLHLAMLYNNLLDQALDLIPPCILKEIEK